MSGALKICEPTAEVQKMLKEFRLRRSQNTAAVTFQIIRDNQQIVVDEELENCSMDELRESLPDCQPRFALISYKLEHGDGRVSFPLCMIYVSPAGCNPEIQMMYAGSKNNLVHESGATKDFEVRDVEELTDEFMVEKLLK